MRNATKRRTVDSERGFALIVSLLLLVLVSGLAIAVMYLATTQKQISGSDAETSVAYYGAEAGMEKMMGDVANLYQQKQSPSLTDLAGLTSSAPNIPGIKFSDPNVVNPYNVTAPDDGKGYPISYSSTIASSNQQVGGLQATVVPLTLSVTARAFAGTEVRMFRKVEVALIPVFQFGVFCDADCSYFPGPDFQFGGRVHTNGNLWLAAGGTLTFYDKMTAAGNVIRKQLANTYDSTAGSYNGTINIPTAPGGCGSYPAKTGTNCAALTFPEGSVTQGNYCSVANSAPNCDSGSSQNANWPTNGGTPGISGPGSTYGSMLLSGTTGVSKLTLPFVGPGVQPIEIIRRPQAGDTNTLSASRLANQASIRILLDDNPYNLSSGGPGDADNIPLAAVATGGLIPGTSSWLGNGGKSYYFATATNVSDLIQTGTTAKGAPIYGPDANWIVPNVAKGAVVPPNKPSLFGAVVDPYTYQSGSTPDKGDGSATVKWPETALNGAQKATDWPLLTGWLRVEIQTKVGAAPVPVTREWLALGFTRQFGAFPNSENGVANTALGNSNPSAIILLQQEMSPNRAQIGTDKFGNPIYRNNPNPAYAATINGYNLLPINSYDPREGELRDTNGSTDATKTAGSCSVNGLMNAVEIDVGNLNKWLKNSTTGQSVDSSTYNGYILYFSDRRGGSLDGGYDYLDTINATNSINVTSSPVSSANVTTGLPDGVLSAEEDVYQGTVIVQGKPNGYPAALGATPATKLVTPPQYIGAGFGLGQIVTSTPGVSQRIACSTTGAWNVVLAPRHVLRLINGTLGNVPEKPDGTGGFTVASEQPVYVVGNYNANAGNVAQWPVAAGNTDSAAAVIADTVTLLSTSYSDPVSMSSPFSPVAAGQSFYRIAIASGKTLTFKEPPAQASVHNDFGTDGGVHNFLRYIENWGSTNLYYEGSMVSLFYSAYGTGSFKCCTTVYSPPHRVYAFDTNFLTPSLLPPGTPQFKDVVDLGFQQDLNP
jgi:hypothetical protein